MTANDPSTETALATIGRLDVADVPDMGYDPWRKATNAVVSTRANLTGFRFCTGVFTPFGGLLMWLIATAPAAPPLIILLILLLLGGFITLGGPIGWALTFRELARLPEPLDLLPPGSSPELAEREHQLVIRIEAHNRNVRLLRGMPVIDPDALERAENEERDLRGGALALTEAKNDIAGLLTDGD